MKHSERFNKAITALVKGYLNETLVKGQCCACAVGNMIAHCHNYDIVKKIHYDGTISIDWGEDNINPAWAEVFFTVDECQTSNGDRYLGDAKSQIKSTGYTWMELARIEFAFERNTGISFDDYPNYSAVSIDEDQLKGLHAVVDILCDIEGIVDTQKVEEFKEMFSKSV